MWRLELFSMKWLYYLNLLIILIHHNISWLICYGLIILKTFFLASNHSIGNISLYKCSRFHFSNWNDIFYRVIIISIFKSLTSYISKYLRDFKGDAFIFLNVEFVELGRGLLIDGSHLPHLLAFHLLSLQTHRPAAGALQERHVRPSRHKGQQLRKLLAGGTYQ